MRVDNGAAFMGKGLCTIIVFISFFLHTTAQSKFEHTVHFKNGNVYKGLIIQQYAYDSVKLVTHNGDTFMLNMKLVEKIRYEQRTNKEIERQMLPGAQLYADSNLTTYRYRGKGFFIQGQLVFDVFQVCGRVVLGYKINRFAYIGFGTGIDVILAAPQINPRPFKEEIHDDKLGPSLPLFIHYAAEFTKKAVTPYVMVEGGYAVTAGPMWSLGFGVKAISNRKATFACLLDLNWKVITVEERGLKKQTLITIEKLISHCCFPA